MLLYTTPCRAEGHKPYEWMKNLHGLMLGNKRKMFHSQLDIASCPPKRGSTLRKKRKTMARKYQNTDILLPWHELYAKFPKETKLWVWSFFEKNFYHELLSSSCIEACLKKLGSTFGTSITLSSWVWRVDGVGNKPYTIWELYYGYSPTNNAI